MTLATLESELRAAGLDPVRTFDWERGWEITIGGEVVARGQSIGEVQAELERWMRGER